MRLLHALFHLNLLIQGVSVQVRSYNVFSIEFCLQLAYFSDCIRIIAFETFAAQVRGVQEADERSDLRPAEH